MKLLVSPRLFLFFLFMIGVSVGSAQTTYYWSPTSSDGSEPGGTGTWAASSNLWWDGTSLTSFPGGSSRDAIFTGKSGAVTLDLSNPVTVRKLVFEKSGYSVTAASPATITLGTSANGIEVNHGGTTTIGANVTLSHSGSSPKWLTGTGTLAIGNGALLVATHASAAASVVGNAGLTLEVLAGGTVETPLDLNLASYGQASGEGNLKVSGGNVTIGRYLYIASHTDSSSTVDVNGGTLNVIASNGQLKFGSGAAILNLNGGVLNVNKVTGNTGNTGVFNFNGGTLKASQSDAGFFSVGHAFVQEMGAKVDTNGFNITIGQALKHGGETAIDGGLTKSGAGNLTLTAANSYTGKTLVTAGALVLNHVNALQGSTLDISGVGQVTFGLTGSQTYRFGGIAGTGTLNAGSHTLAIGGISLGQAPALAAITAQTLSLEKLSTFMIGGLARGDEYSAVDLTGSLVYGGVLNISLGFTPLEDEVFHLFDVSGEWSGAFSSINILTSGYSGTFDYATGSLHLAVVPEPGTTATLLVGAGICLCVLRLRRKKWSVPLLQLKAITALLGMAGLAVASQAAQKAPVWEMGEPIVTYWAGPSPITDADAKQMAEGHWNVIPVGMKRGRPKGVSAVDHVISQLDILHRYHLRGMVSVWKAFDLDTQQGEVEFDALIQGVKAHPAFYAYVLKDEPGVQLFPEMKRVKSFIFERDPSHLIYTNLYPINASNQQLGTEGERESAYAAYLNTFLRELQPQMLSYDHYHFGVRGDGKRFFLNLSMIRQAALEANLPFMVIVQACSWTKNMRLPTGDEMRWLNYVTLAYGARGISHYVYGYPGHDGGMASVQVNPQTNAVLGGAPTPLYYYMKELNREFRSVAGVLAPLRSLGAYHVGHLPEGGMALPDDAVFQFDPPVAVKELPQAPASSLTRSEEEALFAEGGLPGSRVEGLLVGVYGKDQAPTHALVVNLDYRTFSGLGHPRSQEFKMLQLGKAAHQNLVGPGRLEVFDPASSRWSALESNRVALDLPPGGGLLVRLAP